MTDKFHFTLMIPAFRRSLMALVALAISLPCVADNSQPINRSNIQPNILPNKAPAILIMGDSLSAGFGMKMSDSWTSLLQQRLTSENLPHRVINASISGETTNGGLSRLAQALDAHKPKIVIIELGANDGLRGLPLDLMRKNLSRMIDTSLQAKARVLLLGMELPPNYGPRYTREFAKIFIEIAEKNNVGVAPFLLAGVATKSELMQNDGLHPTAAAQNTLLNTVWTHLLPLLSQ